MRLLLFVSASVVLAAPAALAQLAVPGKPASLRSTLDDHVPLVVLPRPDLERYRAEDALAPEIGPYRYGAVVPTDVDLQRHGRWDQVEETGELVWRVEIASPGAYSLGVLFREYDLPPGGKLFLYDVGRRHVLGAFTEEIEQPNGMLAIRPLVGDHLVIEYVQAAWVNGTPRLAVESVVHDYRDVLGVGDRSELGGNEDNACLIDINCPQGSEHQDQKRAVVGLFRGGFTCSGTILNNTAFDGTPYMLTAEHCGDFTNGVFLFNYERTGCSSGTVNGGDSVSGAQLLAKDSYIDGQLYRLDQAPPLSFGPFYAGWGRGDPKGPTVGISHPAGLPKKITIDDEPPVDLGNMWAVDWEQGEIQGGSSGSSLLNTKKRVIGQLCCGSGNCAGQIASYGQFRDFYRRKNLARWLDADGTGAMGIDGYDPARAQAIPYYGSGLNPKTYTSTLPALGSTWVADVDVSGHPGANLTVIQGHASPSQGQFFAWGELLIDLASQRAFRSSSVVSGSTSTHTANIPSDPGLSGRIAFSQAFVFGGGYLEGTNGIELRLL